MTSPWHLFKKRFQVKIEHNIIWHADMKFLDKPTDEFIAGFSRLVAFCLQDLLHLISERIDLIRFSVDDPIKYPKAEVYLPFFLKRGKDTDFKLIPIYFILSQIFPIIVSSIF